MRRATVATLALLGVAAAARGGEHPREVAVREAWAAIHSAHLALAELAAGTPAAAEVRGLPDYDHADSLEQAGARLEEARDLVRRARAGDPGGVAVLDLPGAREDVDDLIEALAGVGCSRYRARLFVPHPPTVPRARRLLRLLEAHAREARIEARVYALPPELFAVVSSLDAAAEARLDAAVAKGSARLLLRQVMTAHEGVPLRLEEREARLRVVAGSRPDGRLAVACDLAPGGAGVVAREPGRAAFVAGSIGADGLLVASWIRASALPRAVAPVASEAPTGPPAVDAALAAVRRLTTHDLRAHPVADLLAVGGKLEELIVYPGDWTWSAAWAVCRGVLFVRQTPGEHARIAAKLAERRARPFVRVRASLWSLDAEGQRALDDAPAELPALDAAARAGHARRASSGFFTMVLGDRHVWNGIALRVERNPFPGGGLWAEGEELDETGTDRTRSFGPATFAPGTRALLRGSDGSWLQVHVD